MLMALLMWTKWWKFSTKKQSVTSLIFIVNFQKTWIQFIAISKIKINFFQINLMLEFFLFNVGIIRITFKLLSIRSNLFSLKFVISNFWQFFCYLHFFLNFHYFFHFFPNKNCQVKKIQNQNNMLVVERGGNPIIQTQNFTKLNFGYF
jgi:hypothetical protein